MTDTFTDAFSVFVEQVEALPSEQRATAYRAEATRIGDTAAQHNRDLTAGESSRLIACEQRARQAEADYQQRVQMRASLMTAEPVQGVEPRGNVLDLRITDAQIGELRAAVEGMERRAITSANTPLAGALFVADTVPFYRESERIADHMQVRVTDAPSIFYPRITTGATAADMVAEGAPKPESTVNITRTEAPIRKIAHFLTVTQEALDDNAGLAEIIRAEGMAGLIEKESQQLLTGTGTGQQLLGLVGATGTLTYAKLSGELRSVAIRNAMNVLRTTGAKVTAAHVIMHPTTWTKIETEVGSDGQYLNRPNTQAASTPVLWGLPVVTSTHIGVDDALVANLGISSTLYVRQRPTVIVDPFTLLTSNTVRMVVEERLSHALVEPRAVCRVTGLT
jgi:HK97 family phage major capsid protein